MSAVTMKSNTFEAIHFLDEVCMRHMNHLAQPCMCQKATRKISNRWDKLVLLPNDKGAAYGEAHVKLVRMQLTSAAAKARGTFYVQFFHLPAFLVLHRILSYWDEAKDLREPAVLAYLTALHNSCFQKQNVSFCPSPALLKLSHFFLLYNPLRVVNKRN